MPLRPVLLLPALLVGSPPFAQQHSPSSKAAERTVKEVRRRILALPNVSVFDCMAFNVDGHNIILSGHVTRPALKSAAESAVKGVESVEKVDNQIELLPLSSLDASLRPRLFQAIYEFPALQRYAVGGMKPIRIVVKNGGVTLEGFVDK